MAEPTTPRPATVSRRTVLRAGALGVSAATLSVLAASDRLHRAGAAPGPVRSDIQHDIVGLLPPAQAVDGTLFRFGPRYTLFATFALRRAPGRPDQRLLAEALDTVEQRHPVGPHSVFVVAGYGRGYLAGLPPALVAEHLPQRRDGGGPVLSEAIPAPTDIAPDNPGVTKRRFDVPVAIEANDVLLTLRSDDAESLADAAAWLRDRLEGLLVPTSQRLMFLERGLPRRLADGARLPFAARVHPDSPMWMGFADQQADASGPPQITTFLGTAEARLTEARPGDYLDLASVQHLSHTILDLEQFYLGEGGSHGDSETYTVRAQYMFRAPAPAPGTGDEVTDGGGPAFLPNDFLGPDDAERGARGIGTPAGVRRIGHVTALQRSSRTPSGTPLHIRVDGPGFDALDVPGAVRTAKLHFSIFTPTASTFTRMRRDGAGVDLAARHRVAPADNGIERFLTTTRRQNFLVPPRRHRAFPLLELR